MRLFPAALLLLTLLVRTAPLGHWSLLLCAPLLLRRCLLFYAALRLYRLRLTFLQPFALGLRQLLLCAALLRLRRLLLLLQTLLLRLALLLLWSLLLLLRLLLSLLLALLLRLRLLPARSLIHCRRSPLGALGRTGRAITEPSTLAGGERLRLRDAVGRPNDVLSQL